MPDTAMLLAEAARAYIIAAAGCGKTEEIAKAVALSSKGRQLVLTHTHAGVRSLRDRFKTLRVPSIQYHVDTIAGWALGYSAAYPSLSGLVDFTPTDDAWKDVYGAALELIKKPFIHKVLQASYAGIYVDEYQDCVASQHSLILELADILPCRILCDPLQGIFDFQKDDPIVELSTDISPNFHRLPDLTTPWRWNKRNEDLGTWLLDFRQTLLNGVPMDLRDSPVLWLPRTPENQRNVCFRHAKEKSVVAIHKWPQNAHSFARNLGGLYVSMEEIECIDLLRWSDTIEHSTGTDRAIAVIDFASLCMTKVSTELRSVKNQLGKGNIPRMGRYKKNQEIILSLIEVAKNDGLAPVLSALQLIAQIPGSKFFRRELWNEMVRTLKTHLTAGAETLRETAWHVRDQARRFGRRVGYRTVSRTLLIKGLEFEHAIVLDADQLKDPKNLYVAMTRGSQSLTVLSKSPVVIREPINNWENR